MHFQVLNLKLGMLKSIVVALEPIRRSWPLEALKLSGSLLLEALHEAQLHIDSNDSSQLHDTGKACISLAKSQPMCQNVSEAPDTEASVSGAIETF